MFKVFQDTGTTSCFEVEYEFYITKTIPDRQGYFDLLKDPVCCVIANTKTLYLFDVE